MKELIIRNFKIEDYEKTMELWKLTELPYKPLGRDRKERIKKEIEKDINLFLVAEIEGKIVGTVLATHDGRKGWINRLAVHPDYRKKGLATKLVKYAEDWLSSQGIEIIACLIEEGNEPSMRLFKKLGYREHRDIIYFTKRKYPEV